MSANNHNGGESQTIEFDGSMSDAESVVRSADDDVLQYLIREGETEQMAREMDERLDDEELNEVIELSERLSDLLFPIDRDLSDKLRDVREEAIVLNREQ